jgi:hypothetical protein
MNFLVEFSTKKITPVTVEADTPQEAIERVLRQEGHAGDTYYEDMKLLKVREIAP